MNFLKYPHILKGYSFVLSSLQDGPGYFVFMCFHTSFVFFLSSGKSIFSFLRGIVSNLQMALRNMNIFTKLAFWLHEHVGYFHCFVSISFIKVLKFSLL